MNPTMESVFGKDSKGLPKWFHDLFSDPVRALDDLFMHRAVTGRWMAEDTAVLLIRVLEIFGKAGSADWLDSALKTWVEKNWPMGSGRDIRVGASAWFDLRRVVALSEHSDSWKLAKTAGALRSRTDAFLRSLPQG